MTPSITSATCNSPKKMPSKKQPPANTQLSAPPSVESCLPAFIATLQQNGHAIIKAHTREALSELVNDLPAECSYMAGAIGFNPEQGIYSLRIDLTNKN